MSAGTMITDKRWELTKSDSIRADSAHNVRVALEKMDARIERGDGAMVYQIYNRHVAQWQTNYLDNRGDARAAVGAYGICLDSRPRIGR